MLKQCTRQKTLSLRGGPFQTSVNRLSRFTCCLLLLLGVLSATGAMAQSRISGKVVDAQGSGLPGVSIVVKGTTTGTVSSAEGDYTLNVPSANSTLVFSYIGFMSQEVPLNNRSSVNITLATDDKMLNEVIVVGYGEQKKETVTGSVATVKGTESGEVTGDEPVELDCRTDAGRYCHQLPVVNRVMMVPLSGFGVPTPWETTMP